MTEQLVVSRPAAFGKLPWAGDFLQFGSVPGGEVLRSWLEQGVALGASRGDAWRAAFDAGAQTAFLLPADEHLLVGVLAPSYDEVGRRFPFAVFSALPGDALGAAPHLAPLVFGSFLEAAGAAIDGMRADGPATAAAWLERVRGPGAEELPAHLEAYDGWARSATLRATAHAVFGGGGRAALGHALFVCVESIRPFFGRERPPTPLSVRLPVGAGFAGAVAFWSHVVRASAGWRTTVPASFWSFEPSGAAVTLQFGPLSTAAFADLWEHAPRTETLSDLLHAEAPAQDYLSQSHPEIARLLADDASVAELLSTLARVP